MSNAAAAAAAAPAVANTPAKPDDSGEHLLFLRFTDIFLDNFATGLFRPLSI
jgi:hypothetical protein